jgi:hypothetical protein
VAQVVERLPSKSEALSSNSSTTLLLLCDFFIWTPRVMIHHGDPSYQLLPPLQGAQVGVLLHGGLCPHRSFSPNCSSGNSVQLLILPPWPSLEQLFVRGELLFPDPSTPFCLR